jgi:uncharacterized RDD family membrane protein YckC
MSSEPPSTPPERPEQPPSAWRPPGPPQQQPPPPQRPPAQPPSGQQPPTPQGPQPPVSTGYGTAVAGLRPAGFWIRVVAYLIDAVILAVINTVINLILRDSATTSNLINFLIDLLYFTYFWSQRGQTLGMMVLNLRVIRTDGSQLTVGRAIGRYFALILSFLIIFIGVIMVAFDPRKQGLHDKIADTLVVHTA